MCSIHLFGTASAVVPHTGILAFLLLLARKSGCVSERAFILVFRSLQTVTSYYHTVHHPSLWHNVIPAHREPLFKPLTATQLVIVIRHKFLDYRNECLSPSIALSYICRRISLPHYKLELRAALLTSSNISGITLRSCAHMYS